MLTIAFPQIDPVLVQLGPVAIRWYALAYIAGLLGAWWFILRLLKTARLWAGVPFNGKPQVTADHIGDLFVWAALGVILGGRLGYVLFYGLIYETDHFVSTPWKIFYAWPSRSTKRLVAAASAESKLDSLNTVMFSVQVTQAKSPNACTHTSEGVARSF